MQSLSTLDILNQYIIRQFLVRFAGILCGLSAILLIFDIMANADDVLEFQSQILSPLWAYGILRAPEIISLSVPFAALLSFMAIFSHMVKAQEFIALRAVGVSVYKMIAICSLLAVTIALAHFFFANLTLPYAQSRLSEWKTNEYRGQPSDQYPQSQSQWFDVGDDFIRIGKVLNNGQDLRDVEWIKKNADGKITKYWDIKRATFEGNTWRIITSDQSRLNLALPFTPKQFQNVERLISQRGYGALMEAVLQDRFIDDQDKRLHLLWLQRKIAGPLSVIIMLLIAAPLALQVARQNTMLKASFVCILAGFSYFIFEQLLLSLGETGYLPVALAIWAPLTVFALIAFWVLLVLEG